MGFCPFLSFKQEGFTLDSTTNPDSEYTYSYKTGTGVPGDFGVNGFYICPENSNCQMWDATNSQCGMKVSPKATDLDTTLSALDTWFQNTYFNMLNTDVRQDISDVESAVTAVTSYLNDNVGTISDIEGSTLAAYLNSVVGAISELDGSGLHLIGSLLKTATHEHNLHSHSSDPEHQHYGYTVMGAMILVAEFAGKQDSDRKNLSGHGATGSIFGTDFMITNDDTCPPIVRSIYDHPDWVDPPISITWSQYLAAPIDPPD